MLVQREFPTRLSNHTIRPLFPASITNISGDTWSIFRSAIKINRNCSINANKRSFFVSMLFQTIFSYLFISRLTTCISYSFISANGFNLRIFT